MCGLSGPHSSFGSLYIERGEDDMANLMLDFTKGFVSGVAPQSLSELKTDAESIRDTIMGGARTAQDKYREIRQSSFFKKTTDWFFRRGDEIGEGSSLDDSKDDEFDAGFRFGGDDKEDEPSAKVLDYEGMKGIAKGQVSSMYHIAGKQTEASAMTASEIITTINTRSSEILSSLGNINSSLQTISGKLDKLIELNATVTQERSKYQGLFDSSGNLTLGNTFRYIKQNIPYQTELELVKSMGGMMGMMFDGSVMSRSEAFGTLAGMGTELFADKRFKILDDRSINDIRGAIDERVNNAQHNLLSKLLDWDKFKHLFGDLTSRESNKDYSTYIGNQYNRDKAVFDNMTRKTIIDVIPGYLRRITAALTGETLYVSAEGSLTTERPNEFRNVFNSTLQDGFNSKRFRDIMKSADSDIEQQDVYMAQRVLTSLYIFAEMRTPGESIKGADFENGGDPAINAQAVEYLAGSGYKDAAYWDRVIKLFTTKLIADKNSRNAFAKNIRQGAMSSDSRARRYAETATITYDIGEITDDIVDSVVGGYISRSAGKDDRTWQQRVNDKEIKPWQVPKGVDWNSRPSDDELKKAQRKRIQESEIIGNTGTPLRDISSMTTNYVASIFELLNRGINVYAVRRKKPYDPMELLKVVNGQAPPTPAPQSEVAPPTVETPAPGESGGEGPEQSGGGGEDGQPSPQGGGGGQPAQQQSVLGNMTQGLRNALANPFNQMKERVMTDLTSLRARTVDTAVIDYNRVMAQRDANALGESEDDKNDKAIADSVLAAMQASVQDGDTKEDTGPLMQQIAEIKNPKLKARLTKVVEGTLQRADNTKPAQSKIGKVLTWGLALVKGFILPKLQSAKTFITSLGKKLLSPIINSLKQSGQRIATGANAIKEGLFGSDESDGLFGRAKNAIKGKFSKANEPAMDSIGRMDIWTARLNQNASSTASRGPAPEMESIGLPGEQQQTKQKPEMESIDTSGLNEVKQDVKKLVQNGEEQKKGGFITKAMGDFVEKFKQTDFGKGFMSAFENKKSKNKEMEPQSLSDQMTKSIFDILKSKDGSGSIFGSIISKITGIGDIFKENIAKLTGKDSTPGTAGTTSGASVETGGSTAGTNAKPEMDSIQTPTNAFGRNSMEDAPTVPTTGGADAAASGGKKAGIGFDIGKMLGGITGILGGLLQAVLTIVMSMKGFKMIAKLVMDVLKNSLKPLNRAFKSFYKAIKPVMKTIQKVLKQIVSYISDLVESIIEIMQPILESIGPIIEQLMTVLQPILEMVTGLVNVLMVPLVAVMQTVVVPILQGVGNTLEIILGIVQVGFGAVLTTLGAIAITVGVIGKIFGAGTMFDTGKKMFDLGTDMVSSGWTSIKSGFSKSLSMLTDTLTGGTEEVEEEPKIETKRRGNVVDTLNGSPMDGIYAAGDYASIYGAAGANQNRFGNYMNMSARGCGPVALADAYARRSGSSVNARGLTSAMASAGAYNPNMGTSVSGFMSAAGSMGMGLRAGGVTPASLKQARPDNPITIVGSGTDFTTRRGNNHYMNVVGTSGGTAYVSNPMNGRIERRSVTSLAANSLVGLYGSGDYVPQGFYDAYASGDMGIEWSDEVQDALSTLKDLVSGIIGIFTGDDSLESRLDKEKNKQAYDKAMVDVGNLTEEERQQLESEAFEAFKKDNPRLEKETDADYLKRFKSGRQGQYYNYYMTKAATSRVEEATKKMAGTDDQTPAYVVDKILGEVDPLTGERKDGGFSSDLMTSMKSYDDAVQQGSFFSKLQDMIGDYYDEEDEPGFYSANGARLYTDEYDPSVFDTSDAVNWKKEKGYTPDIPLIEWLRHNMPEMQGMSSAYSRRGLTGADENVVGLDGEDHSGTDFFGPEGTQIYALTDGVVIEKGTDPNHPKGYFVSIEDVGGDIHRYYHLQKESDLEIGDEVWGGDPIGYVGSTGITDTEIGPHVHYEITTNDGKYTYNPHQFFKWKERVGAPYGPIDFTGELGEGNVWDSHKNKSGVSKFMQTAFDAGLTGPEVATITSTGIWEDAGEKLWGSKSLLNTTYDSNGQAARGIMNWVDPNVDYGDTVEEQLQYIQRVYFDGSSSDFRAKVRDTGFDAQDLAAYKVATGRTGWNLDYGDAYGPYMNDEDLVEGSEHFFRGALVPQCIHTVEGPRKYIGTAVGVYNWLLDEGYIDDYGEASNIDYNLTSFDSEYDSITDSMAANSAAQSSAASKDSTSGVPARYSTSNKGRVGQAYNSTGAKLFDYFIPSGNDQTDYQAWYKNHTHLATYKANMNGKFVDISVDIDSCTATAKNFVLNTASYAQTNNTKQNNNNQQQQQQQANSKMLAAANSVGLKWKIGSKNGVTTYDGWTDPQYNITRYHSTRDWADRFWKAHGWSAAPNWDDRTMGIKFDSAIYKQGSGVNEGYAVLQANKPMLRVFDDRGIAFWDKLRGYPNTKDAMKAAGLPLSQQYWYSKAGETYDKYYKNINKSYSSSGTYGEYPFKTWAGGDSAIIPAITGGAGLTGQLADMFSLDPYLQQDQSSPVIVNNYPVDTTSGEVLDILLSNTYNVRSEYIESLLTGMLTMMKERKKRSQTSSTKTRTSKQNKQDAAFPDQGIPRQVQRLSVG